MEKLYKLWNNHGECLAKYATKAECVECITVELRAHPFDSFELEYQCTQDELNTNVARHMAELGVNCDKVA